MLKDIISALIGFIGIILTAYGAWLFLPALGFTVFGLFLIAYSFLMARATAFEKADKKKGNS